MMMPEMMQEDKMPDPKTKALQEILKAIVDSGLMESLSMPKKTDPMSPSEEMLPPSVEDELMDEMEDESEELDKPVSLSITQLGAMRKPESATKTASKPKGKKGKRGRY